jgi:2-aminophenol/2-amino-5-chlorophenol 1,6-dioxygenase alpha subunit
MTRPDEPGFVTGVVGTGLPQVLLAPEKNPGWQALHDAYGAARRHIEACGADLILVYSTMWPSILGHQIQARPEPEWVHVDELFHDLGSIPYKFRMDVDFAHAFKGAAEARGLHSRLVDYHGFPIDTGCAPRASGLRPSWSPASPTGCSRSSWTRPRTASTRSRTTSGIASCWSSSPTGAWRTWLS